MCCEVVTQAEAGPDGQDLQQHGTGGYGVHRRQPELAEVEEVRRGLRAEARGAEVEARVGGLCDAVTRVDVRRARLEGCEVPPRTCKR